jgi:hypothetical protein
MGLLVGRIEAHEDHRQVQGRLERGADRDRATLADVDGLAAEGGLEGPGCGLRRGVVDRGQAGSSATKLLDRRLDARRRDLADVGLEQLEEPTSPTSAGSPSFER